MTMPNETTDPAATDAAEWTGDEGDPTENSTDAGEQDDPDEDDAYDEMAKKKGVRQKLKDAEDEVAALRDAVAHANETTFDDVARRVGVEPALMAATGITAEGYAGPHGLVDAVALEQAMANKRDQLGLPDPAKAPRRPQPNPMAGRAGGHVQPEIESFGEVLKEHGRGLRH